MRSQKRKMILVFPSTSLSDRWTPLVLKFHLVGLLLVKLWYGQTLTILTVGHPLSATRYILLRYGWRPQRVCTQSNTEGNLLSKEENCDSRESLVL